MGPIGHFSVGLAAKPMAPKVPLGFLLLATRILDVLAIAFGFAGNRSSDRGGAGRLLLLNYQSFHHIDACPTGSPEDDSQ
jgi:hypothetical protein